MVSRKENAWRKKLLYRKKNAKLNKTLKTKIPVSKQKKQKKNKKAFKPSVPKKEFIKEDGSRKQEENEKDDGLIEFYGQRIMPADKIKMETIIPFLESYAEEDDLRNFVENFSSFENEGILVFRRFKKIHCCLCHKNGHRMEMCPRRWKDGKWMELYTVNMKPSLPEATKEKGKKEKARCLNCNREGHNFMKCPEFAELFEDEEQQ